MSDVAGLIGWVDIHTLSDKANAVRSMGVGSKKVKPKAVNIIEMQCSIRYHVRCDEI